MHGIQEAPQVLMGILLPPKAEPAGSSSVHNTRQGGSVATHRSTSTSQQQAQAAARQGASNG